MNPTKTYRTLLGPHSLEQTDTRTPVYVIHKISDSATRSANAETKNSARMTMRSSQSRTKTMKAPKTQWKADQTDSSGIGVWTADVKNRDCFSSNREEDAITYDDQMPNRNTQLFALRRERTTQW
jgi:hypothetical protein